MKKPNPRNVDNLAKAQEGEATLQRYDFFACLTPPPPLHSSTHMLRLPAAANFFLLLLSHHSPFPFTPAAPLLMLCRSCSAWSLLSVERSSSGLSPLSQPITCDMLAAACMDQVQGWVEVRVLNPRSALFFSQTLEFPRTDATCAALVNCTPHITADN